MSKNYQLNQSEKERLRKDGDKLFIDAEFFLGTLDISENLKKDEIEKRLVDLIINVR